MQIFLAIITIVSVLNIHLNIGYTSINNDIAFPIKLENKMQLKIKNKIFDVRLENNETSKEFQKRLPLHLNMKDLNSNEKFFYLDADLPSNSTNINRINIGDILLYGDNCIVIFYKSFNTPYQYTKIGKIISPEELETTLGKGNIQVEFQ